MPVNVVMPQMGESVAEGTVVRWIKKIGDAVERDEPLFEISTDKVDAEIPSPAAGTLTAIHVTEGQTVPVDTIVAIIAQAGEATAAPPTPKPSEAPDGSSAALSTAKPEKSEKPSKPNSKHGHDRPAAAASANASPAVGAPASSSQPYAASSGASASTGVTHAASSTARVIA